MLPIVGSYVIANDLVGVLVEVKGKECVVKSEEGKAYTIHTNCVHEIVAPHALATMFYNKVKKRKEAAQK